tara:strand:- start:125 stop:1066 length:942 start_codon:yes stop_codon:yes gene_type:complete
MVAPHDMESAAEVGPLKVKSWKLVLSLWSEGERAALRRFGADASLASLFAVRTNGEQLECYVTCKAPRRANWLSANVVAGDWRPAAAPKSAEERRSFLAQYDESIDQSVQGQRNTSSAVGTASLLQHHQQSVEVPNVEQPSVQQPRVEQPRVEQPRVEQPSVLEQPIVEHTTAFSPQRAAQKRHLEEQLEITDIEIEQHEHRRAQLRQQLQVFEYEHALAQPDAQHWPTIRRSDITPGRVEQRVPNFQYCAYHRCFHHVTSFSTTQQFARPDKRYCDTFLAENLRASTVPSLVILESELYRMAKLMKVKVNAD